jgi:cytochrome P450
MTGISTVAAESAAADVPHFPMPRAAGCPFDPPPALQALQQEAPITPVRLWDDSTAWLITRYDDIRALLADPRISADSSHPHFPHRSPGEQARRRQGRTFVTMDDPEHARLRRMVTAVFSIKRVEALRPLVQRIVEGLIDAMLAGPTPVDLVGAFALPVPSLVICHLLGVPYTDHDFFQANTRNIMKYGAAPEEAAATQRRLIDYLDNLVGQKLTSPGDDLLSTLAYQVKAGQLSRRDAAVLGNTLLVAGHETTANMIALGTLALLNHPDQLTRLRETNDPKLIASAVEELLRYLTVVHGGRRRVALEDIQIAGQTIHAGDRVVVATEIGNRDPAAFDEPAQLDIGHDARHHVAFGYGIHQCLGQPLARMELQVVYGTLYRRIPTLRLATDLDHVPFKRDGLVYGVYELPVTW